MQKMKKDCWLFVFCICVCGVGEGLHVSPTESVLTDLELDGEGGILDVPIQGDYTVVGFAEFDQGSAVCCTSSHL